MTKSVFVYGKPIAQPRHLFSCISGRARPYLPKNAPVRTWKSAIAATVIECKLYNKMIDCPVKLSAAFYLPLPKSGKIKELTPHNSKPDLDNLVKALMDVLTTSKVWTDDKLVQDLSLQKYYSAVPGVRFSITKV